MDNANNKVQNYIENPAEDLKIDAEAVRQYLEQHPSFFIDNTDVLDDLEFPAVASEQGTSSLVDKQISFLRERNLELRNRLQRFISIAKINDALLKETRDIILSLIDVKNIDDFANQLKHDLFNVYKLDQAKLILFSSSTEIEHDIVKTDLLSRAQQHIPALTALKKPLCGNLRDHELTYFFDEGANRVGSVAVVPLNYQSIQGLLICGKVNPLHFKASMDTLFIDTLASAIERILNHNFADLFKH